MSKQSEQTKHLAEHYVDQLSDWAKITTKPLFGAVALYRNEHVFAMAWQGALYFKVDADSRLEYEEAGSKRSAIRLKARITRSSPTGPFPPTYSKMTTVSGSGQSAPTKRR